MCFDNWIVAHLLEDMVSEIQMNAIAQPVVVILQEVDTQCHMFFEPYYLV